MSIRKERIKFENQDVNLKFTLNNNDYRFGYQQEIDGVTEQVKKDLTNPIVDNEVSRLNYYSPTSSPTFFSFYFTKDASNYEDNFINNSTTFTEEEIINNDKNIRNSFYIIDFYDNFNFFNQNKIFTTYITKIISGEILSSIPIPKYRLFHGTRNQFTDFYVPKSLINENLSIGNTGYTGYIKFSFYNAKTGQLLLFYNKDKQSISTSERLYFKVKLDLIKKTWYFDPNTNIKEAYQIPITNSYSKRTNESVDTFNNKQQDYPEGNVFNPSEQDYETE